MVEILKRDSGALERFSAGSAPRNMELSRALRRRAETLMPGGVNSPVRAFGAVGGDAPFVARAEGAYLRDADGNRYIDYFGSWGPMVLGHAFPPVVRAVQEAAARGTSYGASTARESDLAAMVIAAFPTIEKLRFVSSGTEATMSAIRVARAFTGRKYIVKFEGCYHGHSDGLLVKAGSGVATFGIPGSFGVPGSAGVPEEIVHFTLALPFNDVTAVEAAFAAHREEIACVIVEPVVGNAGCIPPDPGYLRALRDITRRDGSVLIFDEVMTGFRVAFGGAQELYDVAPDMTTLGKIIGGGLPCAAFGGRAEMMELLAPLGPVYQAGTLSGNPLAMAAGVATVGYLAEHRDTVYPRLETLSRAVADGVAEAGAKAGIALITNRVGAMWTWFFADKSAGITAVSDFGGAARSDLAAFGRFHRGMMEGGVWLPPSQFEACFLGMAHSYEDVKATIEAAREVFELEANS